jgi:hypothetical protein
MFLLILFIRPASSSKSFRGSVMPAATLTFCLHQSGQKSDSVGSPGDTLAWLDDFRLAVKVELLSCMKLKARDVGNRSPLQEQK